MIETKSSTIRRLALALLIGVAACGNFTAGGIETGEARVTLTGDAQPSGPASLAPAHAPPNVAASQGPSPTDDDDQPEGEVEAEFRIYLVKDNGGLTALTDTDVRVRVDLEGVEQPQVASRIVDAAVYTEFRIAFTEIEAEVDAGLIINGEPVTGPIDVELEGPDLIVDRPLAVDLGDGEVVEILVDLNAADWLQAVDPLTGTVSAEAFASFIEVRVQ